MITNIKNTISDIVYNSIGWHTNRKIVVIESDDWGATRMPSKSILKSLIKKGIPFDVSPFCSIDSLASTYDLERLFNVLLSVKDIQGNPAKITANCVVANPDFGKIRESGFTKYYYVPITESFKQNEGCENAFEMWQKGYAMKVWTPQFHGREHVNVNSWLRVLQENNFVYKTAFDYGVYTLSNRMPGCPKIDIGGAFNFNTKEELKDLSNIVEDGLNLFNKLFNYKSKSFIASDYIWSPVLEPILKKNGIEFIQGGKVQKTTNFDRKISNKKYIRHYTGEKNKLGLHYTSRNCWFEPTSIPNQNQIDQCLSQIKIAFRFKKPAIINSHRLNYISAIDHENADRNLKSLQTLLNAIVREFPDVEFMDSSELGNLIIHKD